MGHWNFTRSPVLVHSVPAPFPLQGIMKNLRFPGEVASWLSLLIAALLPTKVLQECGFYSSN